MGDIVDFPSNGHGASGYLAIPASGSGPGLIVIQEWWGLVPHITDLCDRFAAAGFSALAPDLYHGDAAANTEPDEAGKLMMALNLERAGQDLGGATEVLGVDELGEGPSEHVGGHEPEDGERGPVAPPDAGVGIDEEHQVGGLAEGVAKPLAGHRAGGLRVLVRGDASHAWTLRDLPA